MRARKVYFSAGQACCWAIQYKYKHFIRKIKIDEDFLLLKSNSGISLLQTQSWQINMIHNDCFAPSGVVVESVHCSFHNRIYDDFSLFSNFTIYTISEHTNDVWGLKGHLMVLWHHDYRFISILCKIITAFIEFFCVSPNFFLHLPLNFSSWGGSMISMFSCFDIFAINNLDTN